MHWPERNEERHRDRQLIDKVFTVLDIFLAVQDNKPERAIDFPLAILSLIEIVLEDQSLVPRWAVRVITAVAELPNVATSLVAQVW